MHLQRQDKTRRVPNLGQQAAAMPDAGPVHNRRYRRSSQRIFREGTARKGRPFFVEYNGQPQNALSAIDSYGPLADWRISATGVVVADVHQTLDTVRLNHHVRQAQCRLVVNSDVLRHALQVIPPIFTEVGMNFKRLM